MTSKDRFDSQPVPWMHGAAGIAGGAISMSLFYPLDLLRTRMHTYQGNPTSSTHHRPSSAILDICRQEGVRGMYRGMALSVGAHSVGWGLYLTMFRAAQGRLMQYNGRESTAGDVVAAFIAGTTTAIAVTPLNVLKTRTQLKSKAEPRERGMCRGLCRIATEEGWRSLFRGVGPQFLLASHTIIQVSLYERIKRRLWKDTEAPVLGVAMASALAKCVAATVCNPLEVVRTRLQDKRNLGAVQYSSMYNAFRTLWVEEGVKGMYRGVGVNVCRAIPTTVVAFVLYEKCLQAIHYVSVSPLVIISPV